MSGNGVPALPAIGRTARERREAEAAARQAAAAREAAEYDRLVAAVMTPGDRPTAGVAAAFEVARNLDREAAGGVPALRRLHKLAWCGLAVRLWTMPKGEKDGWRLDRKLMEIIGPGGRYTLP